MNDYRQAVRAIESLGIMPDRPPSLDPMKAGLDRMPFLRELDPDRVVVVAGTNGKGSVCATLEVLLRAAGERVGLYTSPHLVETTERFRLAGQEISPELFTRAWRAVGELCAGIALSHFEFLTLMAAWLFFGGDPSLPAVDRAILEVGLGGTWDATNAIPHSHCVITSLGLDHQNLLGDTLAGIAANKFGIIGPGARVVHSPYPPDIQALAQEVRSRTGSHWIGLPPFHSRILLPEGPDAFTRDPEFLLETDWGPAQLNLPGYRGALNSVTALRVLEVLGYDPARYLPALSQVQWPGRMQRLPLNDAPCPVYVSGDHNPAGVASLIELLAAYPRKHLHLLVGMVGTRTRTKCWTLWAPFPTGRFILPKRPSAGALSISMVPGAPAQRVPGVILDGPWPRCWSGPGRVTVRS